MVRPLKVAIASVPSWHIAMPPGGGVHSIAQDRRSPVPEGHGAGRNPTGRQERRGTAEGRFEAGGQEAGELAGRRLGGRCSGRRPVTQSCKSRGNLHDWYRQASILSVATLRVPQERLAGGRAPSNPRRQTARSCRWTRRVIRPSGRAWAPSKTTPGSPPPSSGRVSRSDDEPRRTLHPSPQGSHRAPLGAPPHRRRGGRPRSCRRRVVGRSRMAEQGPGMRRPGWPLGFPHGMDGPGATPGGVGMAAHIPAVAVPYQAPEGRGRSRHDRTLRNGTAVRAAVVQPQRGQRHAEPLPVHMDTTIPCTCTPMSMCTRGTPPTPADRRSGSVRLKRHTDSRGSFLRAGPNRSRALISTSR